MGYHSYRKDQDGLYQSAMLSNELLSNTFNTLGNQLSISQCEGKNKRHITHISLITLQKPAGLVDNVHRDFMHLLTIASII